MCRTRQVSIISYLLVVIVATLQQQQQNVEAAASICANSTNEPCEMQFPDSSCLTLLTDGTVTTEYPLRDADDNDGVGCILCVPPGKAWTGPNPCPTCECDDGSSSITCSSLAGPHLYAQEGTGTCPPSQYEIFTNFTVSTTPRCPSLEEIEVELKCATGVEPSAVQEDEVATADSSVVRVEAKASTTDSSSSVEGTTTSGASVFNVVIVMVWFLGFLTAKELV